MDFIKLNLHQKAVSKAVNQKMKKKILVESCKNSDLHNIVNQKNKMNPGWVDELAPMKTLKVE